MKITTTDKKEEIATRIARKIVILHFRLRVFCGKFGVRNLVSNHVGTRFEVWKLSLFTAEYFMCYVCCIETEDSPRLFASIEIYEC